ncbi:MAG: DNA helicase UvrD [Candidatus Aenigmatarchaeota archaeon]|nr:MAG: DNA helicase UvrD [Candidatus Aenigmarchaeota archaeon]
MRIFADLHIHSRYSRATSSKMNVRDLEYYAREKALNLLGTGDFTHPLHLRELKENLRDDGTGVMKSDGMNYILQTEISLVYKQDGALRKIHNVILAPHFEVVDQINNWLDTKGRRDYDGRPTFGFTCPELVEVMMSISKDIMVIPAHAWTPWFSLYGSNSGFDSIKDCFKDQLKNIYAIETGLSSDPPMNWRLSELDDFALVSNSDSHSPWPWRLGRECNVFNLKELTYRNLVDAIKKKDPKRFEMTIEVDPAYGKYHYDGHRACGIVLSPKEAIKLNNICPVCGRPLTIGVEHRVEELADREEGFVPKDAIPFRRLLPLSELIAGVMKIGNPYSKKVMEEYSKLIKRFGNEFEILLNVPEEELMKVTDEKIVRYIIKNRNQEIEVKPGYDGVYGVPIINSNEMDLKRKTGQKSLFHFK